jgi:hypothetical protein
MRFRAQGLELREGDGLGFRAYGLLYGIRVEGSILRV